MKLYFSPGACSLAVRILIHEMNLPCEYARVNLGTKKLDSGEDYLKINPKGAVPALLTDKGEVLTENAVIQQYLADVNQATALLPPLGDLKRYQVLEWLNFVSTEVHKGFSPLFNPKISDEMKEQLVIPQLKAKLKMVEQCLGKNHYLSGENFSLPDAYLFTVLRWASKFKIDLHEFPQVSKYYEELKKRKSIHQALAEEGLLAAEKTS